MNDFDPGPLADLAVEPAGDRWTAIFVRELRHPVERVWSALTEPGQLAAWAPFLADRDLGTVGEATLTMVDGAPEVPMASRVLRAQPPTLLEYDWGGDLLRWELEPTASGTRLTLRHTIAERDDVPKMAAGWHLCLAVADRLMDGDPVDPIRGADANNYGWSQLRDRYRDQLGTDR
jgi:uncharacterized protein YndB with AHSA1/START domain